MNRAYKLVWNSISGSWVVASELAKGAKKSSGKTLRLAVLVTAALGGGVAHAAIGNSTLPSGENVVLGSASMDRSVSNQLTVNQQTAFMQTLWNDFSVGKDAKVIFNQPDASSVALNTVIGQSASEIMGQVQANGKFYLTNAYGITFGAGSQVNAAAIVASTAGYIASSSDGSSIDLRMNQGATISNYGTLTASAGNVMLLADNVINAGSISATGGDVTLMNAREVQLQNGVLSVTTPSIYSGVISNSGSITATQVSSVGGKILLTGDTSQTGSKIQLAGTLQADSTTVNGRSVDFNGTLDINGSSHAVALTTTDGYSLSNAGKVNLNGSAAAFSANGDAYTVVHTLSQLQSLNSNKSGKYVLAADIDGLGVTFTRIGDPTLAFSGVVDGLGHKVSNLNIGQSGQNSVGLFGVTNNATLRNIGVQGLNVGARNDVGLLVGSMQGGSISNSYAFGTTSRTAANAGYYSGGLVGLMQGGSISNSYAGATVTSGSGQNATSSLGGLVGRNVGGSISNSYATSVLQSTQNLGSIVFGGLVGTSNAGSITNSYAAVTLDDQSSGITVSKGGLVGSAFGGATASNSYWNTDTSGLSSSALGTGLSNAQMKQVSSFNNWSIDAEGGTGSIWRIYEGSTAPLLRSFLKQTWATTANSSKTYDGTTAISSSHVQATPADVLQGTAVYVTDSRNAGNQTINIRGLYSNQQGYDLVVNKGTASIAKAALSISATNASKTYDGTTSANASAIVSSGSLFGGDSLNGATFNYDDKNAGTGKHVIVSNAQISDGNNGGNYDVSYVDNTSSSISKASLIISTSDVYKTYDGTTSAAGSAVAVGGTQLFGSDSLSGGTFVFDNRNAGTGKTVTVSGVTVNDGNNGGNYDVTYVDNTNSSIDKAAINISAATVSKTYDGTTSASTHAVVIGGQLYGTDSMSGGTFAFADKNAGTGKTVTVSGVTISDGNGGNNYDVGYFDNTNSSISKRLLTISAVADSKEYDGKLTASATAKPVVVGRQRGDSIVGLTQSYLDKNAGTGKTINVDAGYTIRDGNNGNNYDVVLVNSTAGVITPKALTISTVANSKVYDGGVTSANKPVVTGLISGDRVTGLFQQYETKTVGTGKKLIVKSGYVVNDGNGGNNYTVTEQGSNDGVITAN